MTIANTINHYARKYTPYRGEFVNHLPMGQLALYKMVNDVDKVNAYTENYLSRGEMDLVKEDYEKLDSLEDCLGKRELYEGGVDLIRRKVEIDGLEKVIKEVLNTYTLGLSSGLFHTTIRVAYGIEGLEEDSEFQEEVERALGYYVTAYTPGKELNRKVRSGEFIEEVEKLVKDPHIKELLDSQPTRGQKIKALYSDEKYLKTAPLIEGSPDEKIKRLLELLLPILDATNNIAILHCITGLNALTVLEDYFQDYDKALDIMTGFILTHILTVDGIEIGEGKIEVESPYWDEVLEKTSKSSNVHTLKLNYILSEFNKVYKMPEIKKSAWIRVNAD